MFKKIFTLAIVAGAGFAAWHAAHPAPAAATQDDSAAPPAQSATMARIHDRIGAFGVRLAGNQIRASVKKTETELAILAPAIRRTSGTTGRSAAGAAVKAAALDSLSLVNLDSNHPVKAIRIAIDARGYIDLIRSDVSDETAAR